MATARGTTPAARRRIATQAAAKAAPVETPVEKEEVVQNEICDDPRYKRKRETVTKNLIIRGPESTDSAMGLSQVTTVTNIDEYIQAAIPRMRECYFYYVHKYVSELERSGKKVVKHSIQISPRGGLNVVLEVEEGDVLYRKRVEAMEKEKLRDVKITFESDKPKIPKRKTDAQISALSWESRMDYRNKAAHLRQLKDAALVFGLKLPKEIADLNL